MNDLRIFAALFVLSLVMITCTTPPILSLNDPLNPSDPTVANPCPEGVISFQYEILPLINSSCALSGCHNAASHREGVVLDSYQNIMKQVKPNNANGSKLYKSLLDSGEDKMPPYPYASFTSEQINLIKDWINQGAQETNCGIPCDPEDLSFATAVFPALDNFCIGCHNNQLTSGNVNLADYNHIKVYAQNGKLLGSIQHTPGYIAMPPSGELSACQITQISGWIDAGYPNN
ncbi:MAG: hypothetical protein KDC34_09380 [Saprospiraceae bacterium]|nr:hypothetical protein [Saprospiraceae bacterium]